MRLRYWLVQYIAEAATKVRANNAAPFVSVAESLEAIAAGMDTEVAIWIYLERRLTFLEETDAAARSAMPDDDLLTIRRDLDSESNPFRGKMTADQISMLERRYLDTAVLQRSDLPRLSLFYIH